MKTCKTETIEISQEQMVDLRVLLHRVRTLVKPRGLLTEADIDRLFDEVVDKFLI